MDNLYGICNLALVPLRESPSHRSEMVSQLLFGDSFEITLNAADWVRVVTAYDGYEGWVQVGQFAVTGKEIFEIPPARHHLVGLQSSLPVQHNNSGKTLHLLTGSSLPLYKNGRFSINDEEYTVTGGEVIMPDGEKFADRIIQIASFYLGAPYVWGGRSLFGMDCSGFTQLVYKLCGIRIRRDARQQALQGETVDFLQSARAGDLAFFDNNEGAITHVGIMINNRQIIHASGQVRMDMIDDQGIYNKELKRYTHNLRIVKRFSS